MCRPAAPARLDSPVLHDTFTAMPRSWHRRPAAITARMPPSLMVLRLTPRAALRSSWRRMSSREWMLSSAPIAKSAAAATAAIPAMSSAATGCSKKSSPLPATARAYCSASAVLQPWLASDEISSPGPSKRQTWRVRSPSINGLSMPTLSLKALGLLFLGVAQVAGEVAVADDAEQRHAASLLAAEQRVNRLAGGAADQIVDRHFDRGLGGVVGVHARRHRRHRAGDVLGRAALDCRREIGDRRHHALDGLAGHGRRRGGLAPADGAVVGLDADQHIVRLPDLDAGHEHRLLHREADRDRLDALDPHGLSSFELDQGAEKIAGMDESDALAGDVVLRLAAAQHAHAVVHVQGEMMDAALGIALEELSDRRIRPRRLHQLDLAASELHVSKAHALLGVHLSWSDGQPVFLVQRARRRFEIRHDDRDMAQSGDHGLNYALFTCSRRSSRQRLVDPEMVSQKACPDCGAEIPVHEGVRAWCERCDWNIGSETRPVDEGFFARQYIRIGERYGKTMLEALKLMPAQSLRPRWTIRKGLAFFLAANVHLLTLTLFVAGIFLIAAGCPEIPLMLLGAGICVFAWLMRPKPG